MQTLSSDGFLSSATFLQHFESDQRVCYHRRVVSDSYPTIWDGGRAASEERQQSGGQAAAERHQMEADVTAQGSEVEAELHDMIREFYAEYAPDELDTVDEVLAQHAGKEEQLFADLQEKYLGEVNKDEL